jgi:conjugative transposon TraM protein
MTHRRFTQPRYVIPLILLPFLFLFYFIFRHWDSSAAMATSPTDTLASGQLNPDMPGVAKRISEDPVKDKFDAYQEAYRNRTDFSMLGNIEGRGQNNPFEDPASAYSRSEIEQLQAQKTLDSLQRELSKGQQVIDRQMPSLPSRSPYRSGGSSARPPEYGRSEEETFLAEIERLTRSGASAATAHKPSGSASASDSYGEQMKLFREQMRLMDSMQQSATAGSSAKKPVDVRSSRTGYDPAQDTGFKPLPVSIEPGMLSSPQSGSFHTLRIEQKPGLISAIIDQDLRVHTGGRVRIRLLQDIYVASERIPKGTHLYAQVTGFQTTRINLSITQINHNQQSLSVALDVYDTDGYLGLHVPGSHFREFTKEIGTQGTRGLSQIRMADGSDPVSGLLTQLFQTAGSSTNQLIRREKARLTYNYAIYLKEKQ